MFLKTLKLTNFRNYTKLIFNFKNKITVLVGDNAQGKTNFLEAIYFLATTKSLKADREEELIKKSKDFLRVEGYLENETVLEIAIQLVEFFLRKKIKINGVPRRVSDYSQHLAVIEFSPEDINLVIGSPSIRRYHFDQVLSQADKEYKKTLSSYENILTRKNKILKKLQEGFGKKEELNYWLDQQIILGNILIQKREQFFEFINSTEKKFGPFFYKYLSKNLSLERLQEYLPREIASASSLIGPHRDDFLFLYDGDDLSKYGSRGEQRTAVLDLKLAEVEFVEKTLGDRPVLLLDDIFSELDFSHRKHVIDLAKLQQTIITAVEMDISLKKELKNATIVFVQNGQIVEKADK